MSTRFRCLTRVFFWRHSRSIKFNINIADIHVANSSFKHNLSISIWRRQTPCKYTDVSVSLDAHDFCFLSSQYLIVFWCFSSSLIRSRLSEIAHFGIFRHHFQRPHRREHSNRYLIKSSNLRYYPSCYHKGNNDAVFCEILYHRHEQKKTITGYRPGFQRNLVRYTQKQSSDILPTIGLDAPTTRDDVPLLPARATLFMNVTQYYDDSDLSAPWLTTGFLQGVTTFF